MDPTLIEQNTFDDWKERLLGTGNAFTYTAVLYNQMIDYATEHCHSVLKKIQPPAPPGDKCQKELYNSLKRTLLTVSKKIKYNEKFKFFIRSVNNHL